MFICEACHNKENISHFSQSLGPCEGCHKTAICYNCKCKDPWDHSKSQIEEKR